MSTKIFVKYVILLLLVLVSFSECDDKKSGKKDFQKMDLPDIMKRGKLIAITDYNSTNYFIYKGTPMGFQYELLQLLAESLNLDLEIRVSNALDENFDCLKNNECDIIALNLTKTKERSKDILFTNPILQTHQVLVQRKPDNWSALSSQEINLKVIRNQLNLAGKTIYVQENSSHVARLKNLSEEIGDSIDIVEVPMVVEELIKLVAQGEIDYTVCDENVARVNQTYYPNIDIQTAISFPQYIAWAVSKESLELHAAINLWLTNFKKSLKYRIVYNKYFKNRKSAIRVSSKYYSINSGKISDYDDLIKKYSKNINWDWRLLASLIYQESRFNPNVKSWAGAYGLMQLMPATAERFGVSLDDVPEKHIEAGVKFIKWLDEKLLELIPDEKERLKFVLASYNVGYGHVIDARKLADKYGKDPNVWDENVAYFLLNKSKPAFYMDPVVTYGYCRGEEPFLYVQEILDRFEHYKNLVKEGE